MLKIGVIGAGHLGKIHLAQLGSSDQFELAGFYDHDAEASMRAEKETGARIFDSAEQLINAVDVVDIVTPTVSHYEYAVKSLAASKHVFIEKPVTYTMEEAAALRQRSKGSDLKIQVGHVERFNPAFLAAAPHFVNPMFIETHRLAQFNPRGTDVPVVMDLMIHDIDIVLSVVKSGVKTISASGVSVISDTPDIANARIEFENGCVANLTASRISLKKMRKSRFFQRDAYITVDFLEKQVNMVKLSDIPAGFPVDPFAVVIETGKNGARKQLYFDSPGITEVNSIRLELESLADAINNDSSPPVTMEDGYQALSVACRILDKMVVSESAQS